MDIIKEIANNDRYTLHAHTQFCDGHAPMEEILQAAIAKGFSHIGFTPHSPLLGSLTYGQCGGIAGLPSCNMTFDSVPLYLKEIERLRKSYSKIKILAGMEIDYLGPAWGPSNEYFRSLPLDFRIGSVHFIPAPDGRIIDIDGKPESFSRKMDLDFDGDIRYVTEMFFDHSLKMIDEGEFDIIGHFDKIKDNGSYYYPKLENEPWYSTLVERLIDSIIEHKLIVEINTKAWERHHHLFPAQRHWKTLIKAGVPIVVNSDAHHPQLVNASRQEVLKSLAYLKAKHSN